MMVMMMMMMMSTTMPMVLMHKMAHGILISRCGGRRTDKRHSHPVTAKPKVADPKPNLAHSILAQTPNPQEPLILLIPNPEPQAPSPHPQP